MKVIGKRMPFKTNNSSEVLYGLHISNAPTMERERRNERFAGKLHTNSYQGKDMSLSAKMASSKCDSNPFPTNSLLVRLI